MHRYFRGKVNLQALQEALCGSPIELKPAVSFYLGEGSSAELCEIAPRDEDEPTALTELAECVGVTEALQRAFSDAAPGEGVHGGLVAGQLRYVGGNV